MAAQRSTIDFLPREDWERGRFGRFLKWALTVGRHIVIFTELIVILAFLSRFKLDRDLTDLNEKIKTQQAIIESWREFEKDFRFLKSQLQTIAELKKTRLEPGEIMNELASLLPSEVSLVEMNVSKEEIEINGIALSESGLSLLMKKLKNSSKFKDLALSQIIMGGREEGIKFQLKGKLGGS